MIESSPSTQEKRLPQYLISQKRGFRLQRRVNEANETEKEEGCMKNDRVSFRRCNGPLFPVGAVTTNRPNITSHAVGFKSSRIAVRSKSVVHCGPWPTASCCSVNRIML